MEHRTRISTTAAVAVLSLLIAGLVGAPAGAQLEGKPGKGKERVSYGTTSWVSDTSGYSIKGKVKARGKRKVQLQLRYADGWRTIDKARTNRKGKFAITGSLNWYGTHKLRVVAPKTRRDRALVFKAKKFKIGVPWTPRGSSSAYERMSYKGINFAWNPCRTINYRINPGHAGDGVIGFTQQAVALLERATGFKAKYLGTTTDVPLDNRAYKQGADMVIAWSSQTDYPELVQAVGRGGPGKLKPARRRSNNKVVLDIRRPGVTMNTAYAGQYPLTFDDPATEPMGLVLIHELGHAFGLEHIADGIQVMHPGNRPPSPTGYHSRWEAGDLAGLRAQGAKGGCLKPYRQRGGYSALDLSDIPDYTRE